MGAEVFRRFFRFGLVVVSARLLGDFRYGDFSFGLAYTSLFLILADLGIHKLIVRELARSPKNLQKYLGNGLFLKTLLSALTLLFIAGFLNIKPVSPHVRNTVYILGFFQITTSFIEFFKAIFQAFEKMKYDAAATLIETLSLTSIGVGVLLAGGGIQMLALAYLAASMITLVYVLLTLAAHFTPLLIAFEPRLIRYLLREGLPIGINYFFSTLFTFVDTVMLKWMVNSQVVGWYNAAYRLVFALQSIGVGILHSVFPELSHTYYQSRTRYTVVFQKTGKAMIYLGITAAFFISMLSDEIVFFIYGEKYIRAGLALAILIWTTPFMFINTLMAFIAASADRQRFSAWAMGISAFFNIVLNYILIPRYSFVGAGITTLATQMLNFLMHYFYLTRYIVRPRIWSSLWRVIVINLPAALLMRCFDQWNWIVLGIGGIILTLCMTWITHFFDAEELRMLKSLFVKGKERE
ncbi:MAG TPA: flippase [bacterium]|nr:flippase [bacterium]